MAKVLGLKKNKYVIIKEDQHGNLKITSTNHDGRSYYTIKKTSINGKNDR